MPHNVDPLTYKKATAFEALLGYLNLSGDDERERAVVTKALEIIESQHMLTERRKQKKSE